MLTISQKDSKWNMLYSKWDDIFLYIAPLRTTRRLCKVKNWEVLINRLNKHIFRKLNAYWFNYSLMKLLPPEMKVKVKQEDKTELTTNVRNILSRGRILWFWMQWFELQVFLPRDEFLTL